MVRKLLLSACAVLLFVSTASAQFGVDPLAGWSTAQKRAWLRSQFAARVADPDALRDAVDKLNRMSDAQIDALIEINRATLMQQAELAAAQARLAHEMALREQLLRQYQAQQYQAQMYGGRNVGYRPVITTLPSGASLSAGAVVSPDGRYVRINATPFFSSVGPVYNYNLKTGQTSVWSPYGQFQPQRLQHPEIWYDGLRTRYGGR
jgi:hypothetical protein